MYQVGEIAAPNPDTCLPDVISKGYVEIIEVLPEDHKYRDRFQYRVQYVKENQYGVRVKLYAGDENLLKTDN